MPHQRKILGRYIVADSGICHGRPTFTGTRIMVWQILRQLRRGGSPNEIFEAWGGRVSFEAIEEAIALAHRRIIDDNPNSKLA
jgi:uncharacterized protein (DUF433 family)